MRRKASSKNQVKKTGGRAAPRNNNIDLRLNELVLITTKPSSRPAPSFFMTPSQKIANHAHIHSRFFLFIYLYCTLPTEAMCHLQTQPTRAFATPNFKRGNSRDIQRGTRAAPCATARPLTGHISSILGAAPTLHLLDF